LVTGPQGEEYITKKLGLFDLELLKFANIVGSLPIEDSYVRFEILTAVTVKITIFWDVMLYSLSEVHWTTWHYIPEGSALHDDSNFKYF
jgi:hypothetical protein